MKPISSLYNLPTRSLHFDAGAKGIPFPSKMVNEKVKK